MKKEQCRKWILGFLFAGFVGVAMLAQPVGLAAADKVEDVNQLKAELEAQRQRQGELEDRINQLEARQKMEQAAAQKQPTVEAKKEEQKEPVIPDVLKWASKLNWYGDFRYRYEYIDDDAAEDRHRNRIRARLGLDTKVSDEWNLGFRLATAEGL